MKKLICITLALALTGCAAGRGFGKTYQPIVDMQGEDMGRYNANLKQCQDYAHQISAGKSAAAGAIAGTLLGAAFGAIIGGRNHSLIGKLAGAGAVSGGFGAGAGANVKQEVIIMRCLQGRGYRVLG